MSAKGVPAHNRAPLLFNQKIAPTKAAPPSSLPKSTPRNTKRSQDVSRAFRFAAVQQYLEQPVRFG